MQINIKKDLATVTHNWRKGSTVEVSPDIGIDLVKQGVGEFADPDVCRRVDIQQLLAESPEQSTLQGESPEDAAPAGESPEAASQGGETAEDYAAMTKAELLEMLAERGIEASESRTKQQLIELLTG